MQKKVSAKIESARAFLIGVKSLGKDPVKKNFEGNFTSQLETALDVIENIGKELDGLYDKISEKEKELGAHVKNIDRLLKEAKKTVKKNLPKKNWKNFGIASK